MRHLLIERRQNMGSSDTRKIKLNKKMYRNSHIGFTLGKEIGSGGNGKVYNVYIIEGKQWLNDNWGEIDAKQLVVKFFSVDNKKDQRLREERYKRFCREISTLKEIGSSISGIIPIIDSCYSESVPKSDDEAWYIMPKAQPKRVNGKDKLIDILSDMIQLAETINLIHMRDMAHRDIKPDNILMYNNRICLCDFGLVYIESEPLTQLGEKLGPLKILPPEMDGMWEPIRDYKYKQSDVYLFVKVVWMYIKGDYYGFRGEYQRGDTQIYLEKTKFKIKTFEPIHEMLEEGTKTHYMDRISMEECISLLKKQLSVCNGTLDKKQLQEYIYKENILYFKSTEIPNVVSYNEENTINKFMEQSVDGYQFIISDGNSTIEIEPLDVTNYSGNIFEISYSSTSKDIRKLVLSVNRIQIEDDKVRVTTKGFAWHMNGYVEVRSLNELSYRKEKGFLLHGFYRISVKAKGA